MDSHTLKLAGGAFYDGLYLDGSNNAETLKGSNISDCTVRDFTLIGGYEDCIDCVRGSNYAFIGGSLIAGQKTRTFVTLKGGIDGVVLSDITMSGKCKWWWDISLGDHTIYNQGRLLNQKNIVISNVRKVAPVRKVRILVIDCERPTITDSNAVVIKVPRIVAWMLMRMKK